jgi:futalosine hydrolase
VRIDLPWLICAATEGELSVWNEALAPGAARVVSGVGIPATYATLFPLLLRDEYALIVNIGIAGAYPSSGLSIGDIVTGSDEVFADLGMELPNENRFQSITQTPFGDYYREPVPLIPPPFAIPTRPLTAQRGATVNNCTGTEETGHLREVRFGAGFETMEGAAVAHIGTLCQVPVCEIRAISNIASTRDMRPENIGRALRNLREYLVACERNNS